MPRVKRGSKRRERRKKLLGLAKGYFLNKSKLYRAAQQAVDRAGNFAYVGRRRKKRDFRRVWIIRINAAARQHDLSYSQFIAGLKRRGWSWTGSPSPTSRPPIPRPSRSSRSPPRRPARAPRSPAGWRTPSRS